MWCICNVTDKFVDSFQSPTRRYSKHQVTTCRRGAVVRTIVHTSVIDLYQTQGFFYRFAHVEHDRTLSFTEQLIATQTTLISSSSRPQLSALGPC